ncbi:hypothetical protein [Streptomyces phage Psst1]|nr:hypothetical protein [Streptomyces phage Psst1]WPJ30728.1 hypothetical protein [Streptomyces phage Psst2]
MNKADKIALGYVLSTAALGGIFIIKGYVMHRAAQKKLQTEIDAKRHATATVLKMFLEDKIRTKDEFEREYQFAYMTYFYNH